MTEDNLTAKPNPPPICIIEEGNPTTCTYCNSSLKTESGIFYSIAKFFGIYIASDGTCINDECDNFKKIVCNHPTK